MAAAKPTLKQISWLSCARPKAWLAASRDLGNTSVRCRLRRILKDQLMPGGTSTSSNLTPNWTADLARNHAVRVMPGPHPERTPTPECNVPKSEIRVYGGILVVLRGARKLDRGGQVAGKRPIRGCWRLACGRTPGKQDMSFRQSLQNPYSTRLGYLDMAS